VFASGLKWRKAVFVNAQGRDASSFAGEQIVNDALSKALLNGATDFTQEQWEAFNIRGVCTHNYIVATRADGADDFFRPVVLASGLQWERAGDARPHTGEQLHNDALSKALAHKTEFTEEEWAAFLVSSLYMHHFVQGANGAGYFRPALSKRHAYSSSHEASSLGAEVRATESGGDGSTFGVTALMLACRGNHATCVRKLLTAKASHEIRTPKGVSALSIAAEEGYDDIVTMLLRAGAKPNIVVSGGGGWQGLWSPLMIVTFNGHTSTAELLLNHGADVNYADENGWTPLIWACSCGHPEVIGLLHERGCDVDFVDVNGWTGLTVCRTDIERQEWPPTLAWAL
jgi:hypothetical protein